LPARPEDLLTYLLTYLKSQFSNKARSSADAGKLRDERQNRLKNQYY